MKLKNDSFMKYHRTQRCIFIINVLICLVLYNSITYAESSIRIDSIDVTSKFPQISIDFTIHNEKSHHYEKLDTRALQLSEDKIPVQKFSIERLYRETGRPKLVIMISSIKLNDRKQLRRFRDTLKDVIRKNSVKADIALYGMYIKNTVTEFTSDTEELYNEIDRCKFSNDTPLNEAIYLALEKLIAFRGENKGLLIITNGYRSGSSVDFNNIIGLSKKHGIPVNFFCARKNAKNRILAKIANASGGGFEAYSPAKIQVSYQQKNSLNANKYRISYNSVILPDDREHTFSIRLINSDQASGSRIIARSGNRRVTASNATLIIVVLLCIIVILIIALIVLIIILIRQNSVKRSGNNRIIHSPEYGNDDQESGEEERYTNNSLLPIGGIEKNEKDYSRAWLLVKEGIEKNQKLLLHKTLNTIGSSSDNDVQLADSLVSDHHTKIRSVNNVFYLYDLVSENGTFLNGKKLLRPKALNDWDEIRIGKTIFLFRESRYE